MFVRAADLSYIVLTAREVHRLALQSIAEIDDMRRQRVNEALKEVEEETCSHLLGFYKHKRYPSRDIALEYAPEVGWDSTDGDKRSGCQYLSSPHGGLVPRFDSTGKHICNRQEP